MIATSAPHGTSRCIVYIYTSRCIVYIYTSRCIVYIYTSRCIVYIYTSRCIVYIHLTLYRVYIHLTLYRVYTRSQNPSHKWNGLNFYHSCTLRPSAKQRSAVRQGEWCYMETGLTSLGATEIVFSWAPLTECCNGNTATQPFWEVSWVALRLFTVNLCNYVAGQMCSTVDWYRGQILGLPHPFGSKRFRLVGHPQPLAVTHPAVYWLFFPVVVQFMRANIVGTTIVFSLILWLPCVIAVHCYVSAYLLSMSRQLLYVLFFRSVGWEIFPHSGLINVGKSLSLMSHDQQCIYYLLESGRERAYGLWALELSSPYLI